MAKGHNDRDDAQDDPTSGEETQTDPAEQHVDGSDQRTDGNDRLADAAGEQAPATGQQDDATGRRADAAGNAVTRRTFAKAVGAAAAFGGGVSLMGNAAAVSNLDEALNPDGEVTLDPGEYSWSGSGIDIGSDAALVGGGEPGDVVLNLESGTMDGNIEGRMENIVVRGANPESKAGINVNPGATLDGFVWPEGGQQSEDRALYTPDGGDDRLTIRNSAWGWMANNGAYVDKPPVTMENCAAVNNNIAGIRVGHRDGTSEGQTTHVRNCIVAVTETVPNDDTNSSNARGLRLRSPAHLVVENCWFIYLDVSGAADLIELHDGAAGSTVEIRDCAFYNDSDGDLVRDKSGGEMDVTIENCTVAGSGSQNIEPDYSGSGVSADDSVEFPLPSQVTGYAAADEIEGVGDGVGPWSGDASAPSGSGDSLDHTIVLHASPDNETGHDVSFTVDGEADYAAEAEPDTDTIETNDDDTATVTSVDLSPDNLDSFEYSGAVVDYSVPEDATVDISVDGTTTTFSELVDGSSDGDDSSSDDDQSSGDEDDSEENSADGEADLLEVVARQSGELNYEFDVDGSAELHQSSETVVAGHGDDITENGDGTVTVTGFTGNDGYGDAYLVDGDVLSFTWDPEDYDLDVLLNEETVDPTSFDGSSSDDSSDDSSSDDSSDDSSSDDGSNDDSTDDSSDSSDDSSNDDSSDDSSNDDSSDDSSNDDSSDDSSSDEDNADDGETPHLLTVDGADNFGATTYTFTVSSDVVRDEELSEAGENGSNWDLVEDFARDGKVIGLVGGGVDAYRFSGNVTEITVDGDASVNIERNA